MSEKTLDLEMAGTARALVEDCLSVAPNEEVQVLTDPRKVGVARAIARAVRAAGATPVLSTMPLLDDHGNEPPDAVAAAMRAADVSFTCTTHAITHTRARLDAAAAGTRVGVLRGVTEEMLIDGAMTVDFETLRERTEAVAALLTEAERVTVESAAGTDVEFSVAGTTAHSLDGYFHESYGFATLPPGEAPTHPVEDSANGEIVVDVSMDALGTLSEPVRLTVEDGFVTGIAGGDGADALRAIVADADEHAGNLAEFAIGTNPEAKLIGNTAEDKKRAGTVHVAIGDNESLGGTRTSEIHLDGVLGRPTVTLDDTVVVDDGRLRTEIL